MALARWDEISRCCLGMQQETLYDGPGERGETRMKRFKALVVIAVLAVLVAVPSVSAHAGGTMEFGLALPISTSLSFSSLSLGLEAYLRFLGAMLDWETALKTYTTFDSLYIRNTIATAAALHLCFGHVTNLLPYFGSTYFTAGLGLTFGQAIVSRISVSLAVSVGGGMFYPFLEIRFQLGIDP